ncbi:hypothetical protein ACLB1S_04395 [Escherichia coli]
MTIASSDLINPIPEESTETAARQHIGPLAPVAGSDLYVFRPVAHTVDFHIRVTPDTPEWWGCHHRGVAFVPAA